MSEPNRRVLLATSTHQREGDTIQLEPGTTSFTNNLHLSSKEYIHLADQQSDDVVLQVMFYGEGWIHVRSEGESPILRHHGSHDSSPRLIHMDEDDFTKIQMGQRRTFYIPCYCNSLQKWTLAEVTIDFINMKDVRVTMKF